MLAAQAREDAEDLRLIQLANREPRYFGYVEAIRNYGNIMNALNRYNAVTLSLEADNNDDEAVYT